MWIQKIHTHTLVSDLKVSGDFGGDGLNPASIAAFTQDVTIKRVAASTLSFRGQHQSTVLQDEKKVNSNPW